MERKPDINRRKKLRIAMCVFFFFQMVACTLKPEAFEGLDGSEPIRVAIEEKPQEQR